MPRWRPEWISEDYLVSDIFGRAADAMRSAPGGETGGRWKTHLEHVKHWADAESVPLEIYDRYPAVLEGPPRPEQAPWPEPAQLERAFQEFLSQPTPHNLILVSPNFHRVGVPPLVQPAIMTMLDGLIRDARTFEDRELRRAVGIAAHAASETRDCAMAEKVAQICFTKVAEAKERGSAGEAVYLLVECAAANRDAIAASKELAERLVRLAFTLPNADMSWVLVSMLEELKVVRPAIAPLLGRALAVARLGRHKPD
jgi:hypothetical protein